MSQTLKRFTGSGKTTSGKQAPPDTSKGKSGEKVLSVMMRFRPDILATGQDPLMLIQELSDLGEIMESRAFTATIPDIHNLVPTTCLS